MAVKRNVRVKKKAADKAAIPSSRTNGRKVRVRGKGGTKAGPKKKGLYYFQGTPTGKNRRAYFIAMIVAQIGGLKVDQPFKLWPGGTFRTHLDAKRLVRVGEKDTYKLSTQGVNFWSAEDQRPEKDKFALMMAAVQNGKSPEIHNRELTLMAGV